MSDTRSSGCCFLIYSLYQGCTYILDIIPVRALEDAIDAEAANREDSLDDEDDEMPELSGEEESAVLVENIRASNI